MSIIYPGSYLCSDKKGLDWTIVLYFIKELAVDGLRLLVNKARYVR